MPHILFVCTANICRSPVAEGLLRDRFQKRDMEGWTVGSAGTWAQLKRGAAQHSIAILSSQDIDISPHKAREVSAKILKEADLILCMETGHAEALRAEFPEAASRIYLLSDMVGHRYSISDPYGGPVEGYQSMVAEVTKLIDQGFPQIVELAQRQAQTK